MNSLIKELLSYSGNNKNKKEKKGKIYSGVKQYIHGYLNANELSTMKNFKKFEDSSPFGINIKKTTTEYNQRNSLIKNDIININNVKDYNESKNQSGKKTASNSNLHIFAKELNDENIKKKKPFITDLYKALSNNNENKNDDSKEMKLSRRLSYNFTQISSFRKMKFNDERENKEISERTNTGEKLKSRNSLKFLNSSNSSNDSKKE